MSIDCDKFQYTQTDAERIILDSECGVDGHFLKESKDVLTHTLYKSVKNKLLTVVKQLKGSIKSAKNI